MTASALWPCRLCCGWRGRVGRTEESCPRDDRLRCRRDPLCTRLRRPARAPG